MAARTIPLNRTELSEHFGVSLVTIDTWRKEGMPFLEAGNKGKSWVYDLVACIKWYGERKAAQAAGEAPDDLAQIEKQTAAVKLQRAQLELAKARKEVAPVKDFERAMAAAFAEIRTNVMNVPQRVVIQLLGETDEATFKRKLKAELTSALQAAADADVTLESPDEIGDVNEE